MLTFFSQSATLKLDLSMLRATYLRLGANHDGLDGFEQESGAVQASLVPILTTRGFHADNGD